MSRDPMKAFPAPRLSEKAQDGDELQRAAVREGIEDADSGHAVPHAEVVERGRKLLPPWK